jgi:putative toxin-antitoxin system antitoxin component (TIGR02293 family)
MSSSFTRIVFEAPVEIIRRTRLGFPMAPMRDVATALGVTERNLCGALRIRRRMTTARKASKALLTRDESERLLRVLKALNRAVDVLGSKESGQRWLCSEVRSIGGVRPLDLLDTGVGYGLVMDTLGRIEQGIVA